MNKVTWGNATVAANPTFPKPSEQVRALSMGQAFKFVPRPGTPRDEREHDGRVYLKLHGDKATLLGATNGLCHDGYVFRPEAFNICPNYDVVQVDLKIQVVEK